MRECIDRWRERKEDWKLDERNSLRARMLKDYKSTLEAWKTADFDQTVSISRITSRREERFLFL